MVKKESRFRFSKWAQILILVGLAVLIIFCILFNFSKMQRLLHAYTMFLVPVIIFSLVVLFNIFT